MQMRILLAEDDSIIRLFARRVLERIGHCVTIVGNGEDAVAAVQKSRYDLILMDIQMPIMDGIDATIAIRESERYANVYTPIIAFTSSEESDRFRTAGMDGYLGKPVSAEALLRAVKAVAVRPPNAARA